MNFKESVWWLYMMGFGDKKRSYQEVTDLFKDRFKNGPTVWKTKLYNTVHCFEETGSVKDSAGRGVMKIGDKRWHIPECFAVICWRPASIRKVSAQNEVSIGSVFNILKLILHLHIYHSFNIHLAHKLIRWTMFTVVSNFAMQLCKHYIQFLILSTV